MPRGTPQIGERTPHMTGDMPHIGWVKPQIVRGKPHTAWVKPQIGRRLPHAPRGVPQIPWGKPQTDWVKPQTQGVKPRIQGGRPQIYAWRYRVKAGERQAVYPGRENGWGKSSVRLVSSRTPWALTTRMGRSFANSASVWRQRPQGRAGGVAPVTTATA